MKYLLPLALVLAGCISTAQFRRLPMVDQQAFNQCLDGDHLELRGMMDKPHWMQSSTKLARRDFALQMGTASRRLWLIRTGCPQELVSAVYEASRPI